MSALNKEELEKKIVEEGLISDYVDLRKQVQPNGFDCTLKEVEKLGEAGKIDFDNSQRELPRGEPVSFEDEWVFLEEGTYRAYLNEVVDLDDSTMAIGRPRSTLARAGVSLITAVWDAGYNGRSVVGLVVHNPGGVWLKRNARIMQLIFLRLTGKTQAYSGVYQGENI